MRFVPEDKLPIENTPVMKGMKCKTISWLIFFCLVFLPVLVSIYIWLEYDWLIAIGMGLFFYLVSAIVASKLRLSSVPFDQMERNFSSLEIAKWYTKYHFC